MASSRTLHRGACGVWRFGGTYQFGHQVDKRNRRARDNIKLLAIVELVFLRSVLRLLVTTNVPNLPILLTLMMEAIYFPERRFLQEPHGVTSQKITRFLIGYCLEVKFKGNLWSTVSRPVSPGIRPPSWTREQFLFFDHGICLQAVAASFCLLVALPLTRGRVCRCPSQRLQ
jgi:hypothetical protein